MSKSVCTLEDLDEEELKGLWHRGRANQCSTCLADENKKVILEKGRMEASVLIFIEISCVFGELFNILFQGHSLQKLAFTSLDFDLEINIFDSYHKWGILFSKNMFLDFA